MNSRSLRSRPRHAWGTRASSPFAAVLAVAVVLFAGVAHGQAPCTSGNFFQPLPDAAAGGYAIVPIVAEFTGDAFPDVAVVNNTGNSVSLLRGVGDGTVIPLRTVNLEGGPSNGVAGDFNGDGINDLVITLLGSSSIVLLRGEGAAGVANGEFVVGAPLPTGYQPRDIAAADLNGDGVLDLAVATLDGLAIHFGLPGGTFAAATVYGAPGAWDLVLADFDSDGILDAAVSSFTNSTVYPFRGLGIGGVPTGTFQLLGGLLLAGSPTDIAAADLDRDGRPDLALSLTNALGTVLLNRTPAGAPAQFAAAIGIVLAGSPSGIAAGDVDSDGRPDLLFSNANTNTATLVINDPSSPGFNFLPGGAYRTGSGSVGVELRDLDGNAAPEGVIANTAGSSVTVLRATCSGPPGPPIVTNVSPRIGRVGDMVTIVGWHLDEPPLAVEFGGVPVTTIELASDRELRVRVPAGVVTGPVRVTTGLGTVVTDYDFVVGDVPEVLGCDPSGARVGETVTITGVYFTQASAVRFGAALAAAFTVLSDTRITAVVPAGAATAPISVTTLLGTGTSTFSFTLIPPLPVITGVTPLGGTVGQEVTITGANFVPPLQVTFNGALVTNFPLVAPSILRVVVPAGATTGRITVSTTGGSATSDFDFFVGLAPVVLAAEPASGKRNSKVTLTGDHFAAVTRVSFGNPQSDAAFTVISDQTIEAVVDEAATTGTLRVTNPAATGTGTFVFTVLPYDTAARIVRVRDVPNDQGGKLALNFVRSDLDVAQRTDVTGYRVWRRAPWTLAAVGGARLASEPGYWEPVATLPAGHVEGYAAIVATTSDSTADGHAYTALMVQTLTQDPFVFFFSAPDSACSVDNLAPARPFPFAGRYESTGGVSLHWAPNREGDLLEYRLHRGGSAGFLPSTANLVATTVDTAFTDASGTFEHHYRLAAADIHGNLSRYSLVSPNGPTSTVASLIALDAAPDRVRLLWLLPDDVATPVTVYRREPDRDWQTLGARFTDAAGRLDFADVDVVPGARYAYRLGLRDGEGEVFAGETWVTIPVHALGLAGVHPNPSRGTVPVVRFSLAEPGGATLTLYDLAGRRVATHRMRGLPAGRHEAHFDGIPTLPAGVYLVGLEAGGRHLHARLVVID